jgi:hypothetical protein
MRDPPAVKFSCLEARAVMRVHAATILQWSSAEHGRIVAAEDKETILEIIARLYELAETLPTETPEKAREHAAKQKLNS